MPRYVVLFHEMPAPALSQRPDHWDLMLQRDDVLWTWALPKEPHQPQTAQRLADHRLAFLDYEGPISGGRGIVSRWDAGQYAVQHLTDDRIVVRLTGVRLVGEVRLVSLADDRWEYEFIPYASTPSAC
jgi:hypothetical protein